MTSNANESSVSERSTTLCVYDDCPNPGKYRCSKCKKSFYCCQDHQKYHWKIHKIHCKNMTKGNSDGSNYSRSSSRDDGILVDGTNQNNNNRSNDFKDCGNSITSDENVVDDKRICRCMFCGEEMLLGSEDEAIKHMNICIALQEQLSSSQQFTIPTTIQNKMKSSSSSSSSCATAATVNDPSVSTTSPSIPINITVDNVII